MMGNDGNVGQYWSPWLALRGFKGHTEEYLSQGVLWFGWILILWNEILQNGQMEFLNS